MSDDSFVSKLFPSPLWHGIVWWWWLYGTVLEDLPIAFTYVFPFWKGLPPIDSISDLLLCRLVVVSVENIPGIVGIPSDVYVICLLCIFPKQPGQSCAFYHCVTSHNTVEAFMLQ